jgi:hypothetical protein
VHSIVRRFEVPGRRQGWPPADLAAGLVLLAASSLWAWLTWGRLYDPITDQGWYLQVAARLAAGDVLYRDMIWMYGPLPVYLLALLFRWLGTHVDTFLWLVHLLAACGCLLTYGAARFVLAPPLALLGTLALFAGGWWGGFVAYSQAYTGAVPLGAGMGLLFVICLLSYLQRAGRPDAGRRRLCWLAGAGLATGAALLTKPEFAVACLGTGLLVLLGLALFPGAYADPRAAPGRALGLYLLTVAAVAAPGYGALGHQAGWRNVWVGISGYDQDAILLRTWPPWGTLESWLYIVSGSGILLFGAALLAVALAPRAARQRAALVGLWFGLSLALAGLPWRSLARSNPALLARMRSSLPALLEQGIRLLWAPATTLLAVLLLTLGMLWIRAHLRRQPLDRRWVYVGVLALYSALAALRSFLHPLGTFHFLYLDTFFPVLLFLFAVALPGAVSRRWHTPLHSARLPVLLAAALVVYAGAGLVWDADYSSQQSAEWHSPRGTVRYSPHHERRAAWPELLHDILAHTEPGEPIAILGPDPGFYFWTARQNPLRQDTLLPGMESSPADGLEIVQRLERSAPRWIAIPQGVTYGRGWFWELDEGRQAYSDLAPVWEHVRAGYRLRAMVGGEIWGYALYEPRENRR